MSHAVDRRNFLKSSASLLAAAGTIGGVESFATTPMASAQGTAPTIKQFPCPTPAAFPADPGVKIGGGLWYSEVTGNKYARFDLTTHVTTEVAVPTLASAPAAVGAGTDGLVYTTQLSANTIGQINPQTMTMKEFAIPAPASLPLDITDNLSIDGYGTGPDDGLYFTEFTNNAIGRFDPQTQTFEEFKIPGATTLPAPLTLPITIPGPIGAIIASAPIPSIGPADIVSTGGKLWFTAFVSNQIGSFDPSTGEFALYDVPTPVSAPYDVDLLDGNITFTEMSGNKVGLFNVTTHKFTEVAVPTPAAVPWCIHHGPANDPGSTYFTEVAASKIGRVYFATGRITDYPLQTGAAPVDIYSDESLNAVYFCEGGGNALGMLIP